MFPLRATCLASLALACALPAAATAGSLYDGPGPRPGPDILYAGPVDAPQLQNTGVWRAPPILVSGTEAYRDGEFLYQDFLYDDLGAAGDAEYPSDPRYAGNAADLVELRLKPLAGELAIRLTYNAMVDPALVGTTIALGDSPLAQPMPHGALARMPAALFVTVHGRQADATDPLTGAVLAPSLPVAVDVGRRQVELRVPASVFPLAGRRSLRVGAASGPWSPAAGTYAARGGSALLNVAFRTAEPPSPWRADAQEQALAHGDLSPFFASVDLAKLAAGTRDDSGVPTTGFMDRIMASATEDRQGRGDLTSHTPGCDAPCTLQYSGRLQPYAVYVPSRPAPPGGYALTLDLHGCGQSYNIGLGRSRDRQIGERDGGSVVVTPEARGDCYWYFGQAGADVFEAWADAARHYPLDPDRTSIAGSSMGGYGAYKLAAAYPDLFARVAGVAPCPGAGIEWPGAAAIPGGRERMLAPLLPSLRHVPLMSWQTRGDTTCRYAAQASLLSRLDALGYRYSELTFEGVDHTTLATASLADARPLADFLGDARVVRDPARVTYVVNPAIDEPRHGLRADHAYWLSGVRPSHAGRPGTVDVVSGGLGGAARAGAPAATRSVGALASGLPFVETSHTGADADGAAGGPRLSVTAHDVRAITVDSARARTGCSPAIATTSRQLLRITLAGCGVTYAVKQVCHATGVFDLAVRAPRGERTRRRHVSLDGASVPIRHGAARLDVRGRPGAVARLTVVSVDRRGHTTVLATAHRWCPKGR